MKDIDFDELDKAVNSLMTRTQKEKTEAPATNASSASNAPVRDEPGIPITAAPISPGTVKPKSAPATNPDAQPAITPQPKNTSFPASRPAAPATRRSGRFMDVVPKKPATASRPASREGVAIAPQPGSETVSVAAQSATPSPTSSAPSEPKPSVTEKVAPKSDWPDPIEIATAKKPPASANEPDKKTESTPATSPAYAEEEPPKDQPLTSPFLPGAKVDKRPLGGQKSSLPMVAPEHEIMAPTPDDSEAQLPAKPTDITSETPEEFGGDVMKVEADTHMGMPKTDELPEQESAVAPSVPSGQAAGSVTPEKDAVETPKQKEIPPAEKPAQKTKITEKAEELTTSEPSASGRISIPPQYKEQPSTSEKESGAIYDTSTYHQPLMHPAKKKSGWLWVLWIILILIVGAGAGAALYFLGVM